MVNPINPKLKPHSILGKAKIKREIRLLSDFSLISPQVTATNSHAVLWSVQINVAALSFFM